MKKFLISYLNNLDTSVSLLLDCIFDTLSFRENYLISREMREIMHNPKDLTATDNVVKYLKKSGDKQTTIKLSDIEITISIE